MKKIFFISLLSPLLITTPVFAENSAKVEIHSNINANSSTNSKVNSYTNVTVKTNGETTHYESNTPNQNINIKAVNGDSTIEIDGKNVGSVPAKEISETRDISTTPNPTIINEQKEDINQNLTQIEKTLEVIREKISSLSEKLSSIFD